MLQRLESGGDRINRSGVLYWGSTRSCAADVLFLSRTCVSILLAWLDFLISSGQIRLMDRTSLSSSAPAADPPPHESRYLSSRFVQRRIILFFSFSLVCAANGLSLDNELAAFALTRRTHEFASPRGESRQRFEALRELRAELSRNSEANQDNPLQFFKARGGLKDLRKKLDPKHHCERQERERVTNLSRGTKKSLGNDSTNSYDAEE